MPVFISVKSFLEVEEGLPFKDWSFPLHAEESDTRTKSIVKKYVFLKKLSLTLPVFGIVQLAANNYHTGLQFCVGVGCGE